MVLNGTLATMGVLFVVYFFSSLKNNFLTGIIFIFLLITIAFSVYHFRSTLNPDRSNKNFLNHYSRVTPLVRVYDDVINKGNLKTLLFGHGLGSWGTEAIKKRLSVLVFKQDKRKRDGSALPVYLYEFGLFGLLIVFLDSFYLYIKSGKNTHFKGGILLFIVCIMFYPIFKFMMYMPYYFYIRHMILLQTYKKIT